MDTALPVRITDIPKKHVNKKAEEKGDSMAYVIRSAVLYAAVVTGVFMALYLPIKQTPSKSRFELLNHGTVSLVQDGEGGFVEIREDDGDTSIYPADTFLGPRYKSDPAVFLDEVQQGDRITIQRDNERDCYIITKTGYKADTAVMQ